MIRPQVGAQKQFLNNAADLCIFGGAAGGGKSYALLLEALRHTNQPGFRAVLFRRTHVQIKAPGGLWDQSQRIYPHLRGRPNLTDRCWLFPSGAKVQFAHLQHEDDMLSWQGSELALVGFDELTTFTEQQFWFLLSRNRSTCGIRPYVRATTNPDADSWVAKLLAWWIDPDSGLPLPDRAGKLRWFVRVNDALVWADAPEALRQQYPDLVPKSLAFVPAKLSDNPALMQADPGYLANLLALPLVERERLLGGNWKIRPAAGLVFNRAWFEIVRAAPAQLTKVRAWDKASTSGAGDWSAGVLIGRSLEGLYYVLDVVRGQWSAGERNQVMQQTALSDGPDVAIWVEQEPGSGGKESAEISLRQLAGYAVHAERVTGDKLSRAQAFSAQCEARNVKLVLNPGRDWIGPFLDELHAFPTGAFDDQVDSTSLGFNKLALSAIDPWTVPVDRGSLEPFMHAPPGVFLDQQGDDWETGSDDPFHVEGGNPFDF